MTESSVLKGAFRVLLYRCVVLQPVFRFSRLKLRLIAELLQSATILVSKSKYQTVSLYFGTLGCCSLDSVLIQDGLRL